MRQRGDKVYGSNKKKGLHRVQLFKNSIDVALSFFGCCLRICNEDIPYLFFIHAGYDKIKWTTTLILEGGGGGGNHQPKCKVPFGF
jgi:hypothetical protein